MKRDTHAEMPSLPESANAASPSSPSGGATAATSGGPDGGGRGPTAAAPWEEQLSDVLEPLPTPYDTSAYKVEPGALLGACERLKEAGFDMCLDVGGVDLGPARKPRFEVVVHLLSVARRERIRLKVPVASDAVTVPSLGSVWPSAPPAEREVFDLFGIRFSGHPALTRILMPDDWEGHPLRKDYPLRGERAVAEEQLPRGLRSDFRTLRDTPNPVKGGDA